MNFLLRALFLASIVLMAFGATASTGTPASASISSSVFVNSVGPNLVWDATKDSNWYGEVICPLAVFGPGTDNSTVSAYGVAYTGTSYPYTGATVTSRTINATLVSSKADSTESSFIADKSASFTDTIQSEPAVCVGYGSIALVYPSTDGTNTQLHIAVASGITATTLALTKDTPQSTNTYSHIDYQCWYDPVGIYYVAWTTQLTMSSDSSEYIGTAVNVQAVNATTIKAIWTSAASVSLTFASNKGGYFSDLVAGGSNSSNSSTVYLAYMVIPTGTDPWYTLAQKAPLSLTLVNAASGVVATTKSAIVTNNPTATVGSTSYSYGYAPSGIISSNYMNGLVIALSNNSASASVTSYILYNISNGSVTTSAIVANSPSSYTALISGQGSQYGSSGWTNNVGYGAAFTFQTSGSLSYVYQTYYQNGTVNVTSTIGTVPVPGSYFTSSYPATFFADANGSLWFGYTLYDKSASGCQAMQGYVGKLVAQIYPSLSGQLLETFFSFLLTVMISTYMLA